jgi:hypothetical protein
MALKNSRYKDGEKYVPMTGGKLQIQSEAAEVFYRDIEIRAIPAMPGEYQKYFENNSGVYFRSTGWIERGGNLEQVSNRVMSQKGVNYNLKELIEQYGEDNGRFLYEQFTDFQKHYRQLTFIETGIEADDHFERQAEEEAKRRGWAFDKIRGDLGLFERLLSGDPDVVAIS